MRERVRRHGVRIDAESRRVATREDSRRVREWKKDTGAARGEEKCDRDCSSGGCRRGCCNNDRKLRASRFRSAAPTLNSIQLRYSSIIRLIKKYRSVAQSVACYPRPSIDSFVCRREASCCFPSRRQRHFNAALRAPD